MGLLTDGSNYLSGVFGDSESVTVLYTRVAHTISVSATRGQTELPMVDTNGLGSTFHAADFLIDSADLDFGDGPIEPKSDDHITDGSRVYKVLKVPGADCFRYSDPDRITLRVHTKYLRSV